MLNKTFSFSSILWLVYPLIYRCEHARKNEHFWRLLKGAKQWRHEAIVPSSFHQASWVFLFCHLRRSGGSKSLIGWLVVLSFVLWTPTAREKLTQAYRWPRTSHLSSISENRVTAKRNETKIFLICDVRSSQFGGFNGLLSFFQPWVAA